MRIVHLIGYFQPELGYREYYYARNLAKLGHEVFVITSDRIMKYEGWDMIANDLGISLNRSRGTGVFEVEGFSVYRLPTFFEYHDFILLRKASNIIKMLKPDIIHAYEARQGITILGALLKKKIGCPLVYEHEQREPGGTFQGKLGYWMGRKFLIDYMVKKADIINVATQGAKEFLLKFHHVPIKKISFLPLGADPDFFYYDKEARLKLRQKFNINDNTLVIISAGKFSHKKGYDILLDALGSINHGRKKEKFLLILVGRGTKKYMNYLKEKVEKNLLKDQVLFIPFLQRDMLRQYYSASDLGIWPKEPSITIFEAMACSLPVLLPRISSFKHLIDNSNIMSFSLNDTMDLQEKLQYLILNQQKLKLMRKKIQKIFEENFSYKIITKKLERIYFTI